MEVQSPLLLEWRKIIRYGAGGGVDCGMRKINEGVKSVYEFMYKHISVEMLLWGGLGEELSKMGVYHPTL